MSSSNRTCLAATDCIVLAGGLGTRLAMTVPNVPKVLAPIRGVPFLSILLNWLVGFGARRVVLVLGHRADQVLSYLDGATPDGLDIVSLVETKPLGTAGAVRFAASYVKSDPVLLLNGDSFMDADLRDFMADHALSGCDASVLCTRVADVARYGTVAIDDDGAVEAFREKDVRATGAGVINAGAYLFSREFVEFLKKSEGKSLERDVFAQLPPGTLHAYVAEGRFIDIGTPEDFARASNILGPYLPA